MPLPTFQEQRISQSCPPSENIIVSINEKGLTSMVWTEYAGTVGRIRKSTIPISDITAETVAADGVALRQADHTGMTQRTYSYDTLGRPLTRSTARKGTTVNDTFSYSNCSELTEATVSGAAYSYAYDNIGNRKSAQEAAEEATAYTANALNQYTAIQQGTEEAFVPIYDADGNQTQVKTSTGIWDLATMQKTVQLLSQTMKATG